MKVLKTTVMVVALTLALAAGPAFAQATPPPQNPPAQQPPATPPAGTQPPAAQQPAPAPQPPKPFPEGAKVAVVNMQAIASNSVEGKAATAKIQDLVKRKNAELAEKNKQGQALQTKLQQGGSVLSEQARLQAEKDLQKIQRDLQAMQEDAQLEQRQLTEQLQMEFQERLNPIINQIATEKGLHLVFAVGQDSNVVWGDAGIDLTAEVIKRFDAAPKTAPKK